MCIPTLHRSSSSTRTGLAVIPTHPLMQTKGLCASVRVCVCAGLKELKVVVLVFFSFSFSYSLFGCCFRCCPLDRSLPLMFAFILKWPRFCFFFFFLLDLTSCRQYTWIDERGKKIRLSAPQYIDYVMTYAQRTVNDESIFPTKFGTYSSRREVQLTAIRLFPLDGC